MIKHIDLFMPVKSQYGVLHHFTVELAEALRRQGVKCRILEAERCNPGPFLEKLFSDPPDCTLSFNGLLPDEEGRFFCEMIKIPHVACLVDSPNHFVSLARSPYSIVTCSDKIDCDFFRGLHQNNVIFMPHGFDQHLISPIDNKRTQEVTVLASFIDYEHLQKSWKQKYPASLCKAIEEAAEHALAETSTSYVQALVDAINRQMGKPDSVHPKDIDFIAVLDDLVTYMKGKDRLQLVKAIKDARVDIYGSSPEGMRSWIQAIGKEHPNITCHPPISFNEALEVMKESKIVLNSYPWVKYGAHERLFTTLACGAQPITTENTYLRETFTDGKDIAFYRYGQLDKVNGLVNSYLKNEGKRIASVEAGQKIILKHHTWDLRVKDLLKNLEPMLESIKAKVQ